MELKKDSFEFEGVKYTIRRVTTKERAEIMDAFDEKKGGGEVAGNIKQFEIAVVEPKLTREQIENYDSTHVAVVNYRIIKLNTIADPFGENSKTGSTVGSKTSETQKQ